MRSVVILCSVLLAAVYVMAHDAELPLAQPCNAAACQLPHCRCTGTDIPRNLKPRDTPQFVVVTFDDGINVNNILTYREILYDRKNKNSCAAGVTFYINHEYTSYQLVNELYNRGFEIALHSMTHQANLTYWSQATYEDMRREFADQKIQMSHFANIPYDEIKGIRIPFLQMTGNATFEVMADVGLIYDNSWGTNTNDPGLWPYTLDYASTQECMIPPCPTASIPGVWVKPIVGWNDLAGNICSMVDACIIVPPLTDSDAWFDFIVTNFERHYLGNRSPFGFYIHEWYLSANPAVKQAFVRFMDQINEMYDVFMVNAAEVVEWTKNPIPLDEYVKKPCRSFPSTTCAAQNCGPLDSEHNQWSSYYMSVCTLCPPVYPWIGNPLGQ